MLSDDNIEKLWVAINKGKFMFAGFNTFARAIEAAVLPEGWVAVPKEPTREILAVIRNERGAYDTGEELYADLIAAAPKAQADKQEPVVRLHITQTGSYPDVQVEVLNGEGFSENGSILLYTRPQPDLTAEVERLKLSAEHWNRLYREKCQEFHDAQANKGHEIVWLIDRIAALEEAAREARGAFEQHDGNYKLSKASGAVVEAAIAKLDAVLGGRP